jgi:flagellar biosynthesis/type III secretory pathway protein FliH
VRFGFDKGIEEGRQEGRQEGRAEGVEEGRRAALRRAVLDVLEARGLPMTPDTRARIEAEASLERLHEWHKRALTAETAADAVR